MSQNIQDLFGMSAISLGVGTVGVILSLFWLRTTKGVWPDKYDVFGLMKVYSVIVAFGLIMYLLFKYG